MKYPYLRKSFKYFFLQKKYLILVVVFSILCGVFPLMIPVFEGLLLSSVINNIPKVLYFSIWLCSCAIVFELFFFLLSIFYSKLVNCVSKNIKIAILKAIPDIKSSVLDSTETGTFTTRVEYDCETLARSVVSSFDSVVAVTCNFAFVCFIFVVNIWLGLFVLGSFIILFFVESIRIIVWKHAQKKLFSCMEETESVSNEIIFGSKEIKLFSNKKTFFARANKTLSIQERINVLEGTKQAFLVFLSGALSFVMLFAFLGLSVYFITIDALSVSAFLVVYIYRTRASIFLKDAVNVKAKLAEGEISASRIFEIIDGSKKFPKDTFGKIDNQKLLGSVSFTNVSFAYKRKKKILDTVSFEVLPRTICCLVGGSGQGKTTILSLIAGLNYSQSGLISIDKFDVSELSENQLRNSISYVQQTPFFFEGTIKYNLQLVNNEVSFDEIVDACRDSNILEPIQLLPLGFDTILNSNSFPLSAGERQRLALARAVLKKSKILLLDEPSSHLDVENQKLIAKSVIKISKKMTVICATHNLQFLKEHADYVFEIRKEKLYDLKKHPDI